MVISAQRKSIFKNPYFKLFASIAIIMLIVVLLIHILGGKRSATGSFPDSIKTESLDCSASKLAYEKLEKDSAINSNVRVIGVFESSGSLIKLSFEYVINYDSRGALEVEEPYLRARFAKNLEKNGLAFDEFNNKFTIFEKKNTLSLYAEPKDFTANTAAYFLLDSAKLPSNLSEYRKAYEKQGFRCSSTVDD